LNYNSNINKTQKEGGKRERKNTTDGDNQTANQTAKPLKTAKKKKSPVLEQ
jgi:hypothetical protein